MLGNPTRRGDAVLDRGGEAMLGRAAVADRDDRALGTGGEVSAGRGDCVERAEQPPAAEEIDERRHGFARAAAIEA